MSLSFRRLTGSQRPRHFIERQIEVAIAVSTSNGYELVFSCSEEAARWARETHMLDLDEDTPRRCYAPRRRPDA